MRIINHTSFYLSLLPIILFSLVDPILNPGPFLCVLRAMGDPRSRDLPSRLRPDRRLATADSASRIRRLWHTLSENGASQSTSRTIVENVIGRARKCLDEDDDDSAVPLPDELEDFAECQDRAVNCDLIPTVNQFRTTDSICNNLQNPLWGASDTAFSRLRPSAYEDGISCPVGYTQRSQDPFGPGWPSAREISRRVVLDRGGDVPISHMLTSMSQFVAHDLDLMGEFDTEVCEEYQEATSCDQEDLKPFCYNIPVHRNDPVYGRRGDNKGQCLPLTRSVGECIRSTDNGTGLTMPRQQLNEVTHYLDGSAIYGSNAFVIRGLRSFQCGQMKVGQRAFTNKGDPPFTILGEPSQQGTRFFGFGDFRGNSLTPLMMLQTIFLREHNRIAREFANMNPCWDDERIFQEARKIVGALVQIVTYEEMLPAVYGEDMFAKYIGPYEGYDPTVPGIIFNEFANAGLRFGHSMLSDSFARLDSNNEPLPIGPLSLRESFLNTYQYFVSGGTDPILRGYLQDQSRRADEFYNRVFTTQFNAVSDDSLGQDIAARDIQRGRDHGFPSYRDYEKFCEEKYNITASFSPSTARSLRNVYGLNAFQNAMDLHMAALAENHLDNSHIGPTTACLMSITFKAIRIGDRFWWQNPGTFTESQRDSLSKIRLSKIICDNADSIPMIRSNVFVPGGVALNCNELPALNLTLWKDNCGNVTNCGLCM